VAVKLVGMGSAWSEGGSGLVGGFRCLDLGGGGMGEGVDCRTICTAEDLNGIENNLNPASFESRIVQYTPL
jgi:hypothetical protein